MHNVNSEFDLAIVGGGPAGSSAAITAARLGYRVGLFEARSFPRHKVCGEFVSAESLDVLRELLRDLPKSQPLLEESPIVNRTRLFFGNRRLTAPVSPAARSITRYDLDASLWEAAEGAGVQTNATCEVTGTEGDGPFRLKTAAGEFSARALLMAAGRWSQFTPDRKLPAGPKWIGVKAHFREARASRTTDLYFFANGYCGVQPIEEDVVNACAMVRSDQATSLPDVFALHRGLAERTSTWIPLSQPVSTAPLVYRRPLPVRKNILFAGDAAAFIDPFVGDGISIALRSGRAAAQRLTQFLSGQCSLRDSATLYEQDYRRQFVPLLSAASRMRSLMSLPEAAKVVAFELLRLPGVMPLVIRKTRQAA